MAENVDANDQNTTDNPVKSILKRRKKEEDSGEKLEKSSSKKRRTLSGDDKDNNTPNSRGVLKKKTELNENDKSTPAKIKVEKASDEVTHVKSLEGSKTKVEKTSTPASTTQKADSNVDDDDYGITLSLCIWSVRCIHLLFSRSQIDTSGVCFIFLYEQSSLGLLSMGV